MAKRKTKTKNNIRNNVLLAIVSSIVIVLFCVGLAVNIRSQDEYDAGLVKCDSDDYSQYISYYTEETELGKQLHEKMDLYKNAADLALSEGNLTAYNQLMSLYYDAVNVYNTSESTITMENRTGVAAAKGRCKRSVEDSHNRHSELAKWLMISSGILAGASIVVCVALIVLRKHRK